MQLDATLPGLRPRELDKTGRRDLIAATSRAAVAAGADGIIVEVHPSPETALCDGDQSLHFDEFEKMMDELRPIAEAVGRRMAVTAR